ncbi:septum formation family protein [Actinoplanes derwentensis]|uniref:Septum formation n=1 Tax=Actinoplanes derwentensis TaxID=113562 RepID=A0A1H2CZC9_9ACTN|nr:septum formation family protein [Actinoplanes derwentensis]GID82920.1 hypothetical protein Ade03nite_18440 [Actinoplanes derwentensis]SDT75446.1 Septum formation [Actinoplanes derwentensis]
MRLRLRARWGIAMATAALLAVAGCGNGNDVDGDLTNDWTAMAPATGFVPAAATCHLSNFAVFGPRATYEEVDCAIAHRTETVFVGEYPAPVSEAVDPPTGSSAGARAAYQICDDRTTQYLGGLWRNARLWIGVTHPSPAAWGGGARWFRCEVVELDSIEDDGALIQRAGSLRGVLTTAASTLALTCYAVQLDTAGAIAAMPPADCATKHNGEFVGVWTAPAKAAYPKGDTAWEEFHSGCRKLTAEYVGVPDDADLQYRTGVVSLPGNADVWAQGDHGVRCYLWLDKAELIGSLRGKGIKALPVQYK